MEERSYVCLTFRCCARRFLRAGLSGVGAAYQSFHASGLLCA